MLIFTMIQVKYSIKSLFSAEAIIYSLVVGNMPYGKRHTSRTEPVLVQA